MSCNVIKSEDLTFPKIKEKINKAGNLFYQYRACRRDAATIYDIENIRHGVVYARTPLQMNDPFDSMVGFSSEKIYDECIDLALDQATDSLDENLKLVFKFFLKYRLIGKTVEFIDALNKLKKYIFVQSVIEHVSVANMPLFIMKNVERLYKKSPADVQRYFDKYRIQLPKITPHVCRHTYCSNMAKSGMNPKVLQYLMGHSDISVTLNTYTHLKLDDAREEVEKLARKQAEANEEFRHMGLMDDTPTKISGRRLG